MKKVVMAVTVFCLASCSNYSCQAPGGRKCQPLSAVYRAFVRTDTETTAPSAPGEAMNRLVGKAVPVSSGTIRRPGDETAGPYLSRPRHMRIWLNAWVDADGDMHERSYIYLRLDQGHWQHSFSPGTLPDDRSAGDGERP